MEVASRTSAGVLCVSTKIASVDNRVCESDSITDQAWDHRRTSLCERTAKFNQACGGSRDDRDEDRYSSAGMLRGRLKEECGNHDGNHAATGGGCSSENMARISATSPKINRSHRGCRRRIRQAALEGDNVHIHQTVRIFFCGVSQKHRGSHQPLLRAETASPQGRCGVKPVGNAVQQRCMQASAAFRQSAIFNAAAIRRSARPKLRLKINGSQGSKKQGSRASS